MRAPIERNHARLVDHLVADRDGVGRLDDLVTAAVAGRHHRVRDAARDAAVVEAHVEVAVERPARVLVRADAAGARPRVRFGRARRDLAVLGIRDEPGALVVAIERIEDQVRRRRDAAAPRFAVDLRFEAPIALRDDLGDLLGRDRRRASSPRTRPDAPSACRSRRRSSRCRRDRDRPTTCAALGSRGVVRRIGSAPSRESGAPRQNLRLPRLKERACIRSMASSPNRARRGPENPRPARL